MRRSARAARHRSRRTLGKRVAYIYGMARVDSGLLTFLGVLIAHEAAYLASAAVGYESSVAHGHLKVAWLLGTLAVLGLVAKSIIRSLRRRNYEPGNVLHLAGAISGGYFVMEQFERALDGYAATALFSEPVFWLGLAVAPLVAAALSWSLRSLPAAVGKFIDSQRAPIPEATGLSCSLGATSLAFYPTTTLSSMVSRRGPPLS